MRLCRARRSSRGVQSRLLRWPNLASAIHQRIPARLLNVLAPSSQVSSVSRYALASPANAIFLYKWLKPIPYQSPPNLPQSPSSTPRSESRRLVRLPVRALWLRIQARHRLRVLDFPATADLFPSCGILKAMVRRLTLTRESTVCLRMRMRWRASSQPRYVCGYFSILARPH